LWNDKAYTLIKSYLEGRQQRAVFKDKFLNNNNCPNWGIIKHGVLQGSTMGHCFNLVYINDRPNVRVNTNLGDNPKKHYADDFY